MSASDDDNRQAQEALRRSEARFAGILEIAADAIISIDERQRIALFNEGAEKIFGYKRSEVIGQNLEILIPARFRSSHATKVVAFGGAAGTARRMGERQAIFGVRKDGSEFSAEASISRLDLFGERTYTVVLRDITERKAAEEALRESERRLWAFLDNSSVVGWMKDEGGRYVFLSGNFQRRFGSRFDNWAGKTDFDFWPRHIAEKFRRNDLDVVATGRGSEVLEEAIDPDGQRSWWLMHKFPFQDAKGRKFVGGLGVDITQRVQADAALAQSHRELETRVEERTRELREELKRNQDQQSAIARLQRMEAIGQLTGGIAHDFNNLLTVISGNLQLIGMDLQEPRLQTFLDEAERAAGMGARLNQRLMTFAKQRRLAPVPVNLNEQVIAVRELLRRTIGENILLSADLGDDLWTVRADPSEIENALVNLAINARDAMPAGGKLALSTENVSIGADGGPANGGPTPGNYVKLTVSDTGTGMTPEVKAHVFEPFFTTKGQGKGTGLGLATIYGFVTQSGGHITLASEPGRGTAFAIYLPQIEAALAQTEGREADAEGLPAHGESILIVEDDAAVRRVTVERLEALGYRTLVAASGQEAVDILAGGVHADLVFSDVVMPGKLSGFDLVRHIATNMPHLKVLLTSGYAPAALDAHGEAARNTPILAKPYSQEGLALAISAALHG